MTWNQCITSICSLEAVFFYCVLMDKLTPKRHSIQMITQKNETRQAYLRRFVNQHNTWWLFLYPARHLERHQTVLGSPRSSKVTLGYLALNPTGSLFAGYYPLSFTALSYIICLLVSGHNLTSSLCLSYITSSYIVDLLSVRLSYIGII